MDMVKIVYNVRADAVKYVEPSTKGLALLMYPQINWYDELGIPYYNISPEDVEKDMQNIEKMIEQGDTL